MFKKFFWKKIILGGFQTPSRDSHNFFGFAYGNNNRHPPEKWVGGTKKICLKKRSLGCLLILKYNFYMLKVLRTHFMYGPKFKNFDQILDPQKKIQYFIHELFSEIHIHITFKHLLQIHLSKFLLIILLIKCLHFMRFFGMFCN